jgi:hypothetical protein
MEREPNRESNGKADKRSLLMRMHQEQNHIEIVSLVRYEEKLPVTVRPHLQAKHRTTIEELQNCSGVNTSPSESGRRTSGKSKRRV